MILIVRMTSTVLPVPYWRETTGTGPQIEISPGMSLQIKKYLRRPTTGRQLEELDPLWVGTRFQSLRVCPHLITTLLPVHVFSQPVKCQSSFQWTIGYVKGWTSLISPSHRATLQRILTLLASPRISSSSPPGHPDGTGCILRRRTVRVTQYAPGHRNRPRSTIPSVELQDEAFLLPHPPRPSARTCLGVGREQLVNKLSCATRLLDYQDA